MKKYIAYVLAAFLYSQTTFAMLCPSSFVTINIGDTIDQVRQNCKPDSETTRQIDPPDTSPHTWTYVKQDSSSATNIRLDFIFNAEHKVINISSNGNGIDMTNICGNQVQTGDTMEKVKAYCGDAMFTDKDKQASSDANQNNKKIEIIEFKYNSTPPATLIFENGKLKSRSTTP